MTTNHDPLALFVESLLEDLLSRGTSGRYIADFGATPETLADDLAASVRAWLTTDPNSPLAAVREAWGEYDFNLGGSIPPFYRSRINAAVYPNAAAVDIGSSEGNDVYRFTMPDNHGICPRCHERKFIGHGPLCHDCFAASWTDQKEER